MVIDFFDENGSLLSYEAFCKKFNFKPIFTIYYGIVSCIRKIIVPFDIKSLQYKQPYRNYFLEILHKSKKGAKEFYRSLIYSLYVRPHSEQKWENELDFSPEKTWWKRKNFQIANLKDTYLRWMKYRILYRTLGTNHLLFKLGITDTNLCSFCHNHTETITHLFWSCNKITNLWESTKQWINITTNTNLDFNIFNVIFGTEDKCVNIIINLIKMYIYRQKLKKQIPLENGIKITIKYYLKIEEYTFKKDMNIEGFKSKWKTFLILTQS